MECLKRLLERVEQTGTLTRVLVHPLLHRVLLLVDPLAVALEVDLGGRSGLAVEVDGLVLHYEGLLWFYQKHRQRLRRVRREGFWQISETDEVIVNCETAKRHRRKHYAGNFGGRSKNNQGENC